MACKSLESAEFRLRPPISRSSPLIILKKARALKFEHIVEEVIIWNFLQVSSLTFDTCLKVKWGHPAKKALYLFIIDSSPSKF